MLSSPMARESVSNSIFIWGPSVADMKGKTTRSRPDPTGISVESITPIPPHTLEHYWYIVVCINVMKFNTLPIPVSMSKVIKSELQKN